jgi:hypothetical protein
MPTQDPINNRSASSLEELVATREARAFLKGKRVSGENGDTQTREHADTSALERAYESREQRKDVTVKLRKSIVDALQRAMHERTLQHSQGTLGRGEPYTRQDIVGNAVEAWLRANGYLTEKTP